MRHREADLDKVVRAHPGLLGIGIDEPAAIVVHGDSFEVIGNSQVIIHDGKRPFYFLSPGQRFNLKSRTLETESQASVPTVARISSENSVSGVTSTQKLMIASTPDAADIEVDGVFMGSTPSLLELATGEHDITIRKSGFKLWQRRLKLAGGEIKINAELEK